MHSVDASSAGLACGPSSSAFSLDGRPTASDETRADLQEFTEMQSDGLVETVGCSLSQPGRFRAWCTADWVATRTPCHR